MVSKTFGILLFGFIAALLFACSDKTDTPTPTSTIASAKSEQPPSEAVSAVTNRLTTKFYQCHTGCQDFKVSYSKKLDLSPADNANGVSEKWVVVMAYLGRRPDEGTQWKDYKTCILALKESHGWNTLISEFGKQQFDPSLCGNN